MELDWRAIFEPSLGLSEIVLRGSIMYLALFIILRFIARRQAGSFGPADLLVIVLIADASQNALGKEYTSVTEGVVLVLTIVAWEYVIDWLAWRYPALRPLLTAPPLQLIANGQPLQSNLAKEMITEDELRAQLRQKGIEEIKDVQMSFLEGDGKLSVLKQPK
jgi:uncharacterized membrane protein YcaP (DUF421 family)